MSRIANKTQHSALVLLHFHLVVRTHRRGDSHLILNELRMIHVALMMVLAQSASGSYST